MATYSVTKSKTATLAASTIDSITVSDGCRTVEVVHHGDVTQPLYLTVGTAAGVPTVAGSNFEVVLAGERLRLPSPPVRGDTDVVVSIICAGAATYSVIGVL